MRFQQVRSRVATYMLVPLLAVLVVYFLNLLVLPSRSFISPTEALFIEGIVFLNLGICLLMGRGGMSFASFRAALLSAEAEAVCGVESVGPAELMRRDSWKPKGFRRASLVLLLIGGLLIITYFGSV